MKMLKKFVLFMSVIFGMASCSSMYMVPKYATISNTPDLSGYKYVYITPTAEKTSVTGETYGNQYGVFGTTISKSINPSDIIAGIFIKHGFIRIPEIAEGQMGKVLVVNFGESGRKSYGIWGAYSIEVTLQLLDASTYEMLCSVSAEGLGSTEADDVREATVKCLDAIFK